MKGIIDIHTHIIPDIDDGSKSNQESMEMLRQAYEAGVTAVIATPHYSKGFGDYILQDIIDYCKTLEKEAGQQIASEIRVFAGQEIFYNETSLERIRRGEVIPLAGSDYILLEFDPAITYGELYSALRKIAMTSYYVVLAHIERYGCLRKKGRLEELRLLGVLCQMNYAHISGKLWDANARWCRQMLKVGMVDILATDMHDCEKRGPHIERAMRWMKKHLKEEYIEQITKKNAQLIIGKCNIH